MKNRYVFILSALGILILYFILRLTNILTLPIFTDEAIYVRWSQIAANDASWRFISLTDGKQPMFVWVAMILIKLIKDPLLAGRVVSVAAGFVSTIGMFFLANELFRNKKIGLLASLIYVLYPFSLVYDRLALYDSTVAMFIIWSLYFEILLVRHLRLDLAMILGMVVGGGMLTKTSADFAFILLPFSLLLFNFKDKQWKNNLWRWILYALVSVIIANIIYTILRLSPFYHIIGEKNYTFIYTVQEVLKNPFSNFINNFINQFGWLITYATIPFFVLVVAAFILRKKYFLELLLLGCWFIVPFTALALFGKVIYPRFTLFMTMPLLALAAFGLYGIVTMIKTKWVQIVLFVIFLTSFTVNDFLIVTNFPKAMIPQSDREQLITGWPSGIGVNETMQFINQQSQNHKIYIATAGTFGLMPYALEIYTQHNPNVTIKGFWPVKDQAPEDLLQAAKSMPTYVVFYQDCPPCELTGLAPKAWPLKQVMQFKREDGNSYYTLYQVLP
jgi:4-amino-4-deoxy-L-arabinose transferase-like glycosyltransferase